MKSKKSVLYVVSTPIGNLGDISLRALAALQQADLIVCENVGQTTSLLRHLGIFPQTYTKKQPLKDHLQRQANSLLKILKPFLERKEPPHFIAYESYTNPAHLVQDVIDLMKKKKIKVALVSSAGTPLISDPGLDLIKAAQENDFEIHPLSGPTAVINSLIVSGFNANYFIFLGMLPKSSSARKKLLKDWKEVKIKKVTAVAYVSKHQLLSALKDLYSVVGDQEIFLANDLTKMNEQGYRGLISHLLEYLKEKNLKGEWVVVFTFSRKNNLK